MAIAWVLQVLKKMKSQQRKSKSKVRLKETPFQSFFPFLALLTFTFTFAGIFYAIEVNFCLTKWGSLDYYSNSSKDLTYWKAFHYIATIESTIGFGDIEPCSVWGQLFTIITAFCGIPVTLLCLTRMGHSFEILLNEFWIRVRRIINRRSAKVHPQDMQKYKEQCEHDQEGYVVIVVPVSFGLLVTFLWISLSSVYFYFTLHSYYSDKNFTVFTAFYFTVVTFFTIGLGDVSPTQYQLVLITYLFIMVGLALVTMCIELMQDKLELFFDNMVKAIHAQYQNSVLQGEGQQTMSDNAADAKLNVKQLMNQDRSALLQHFLSKRDTKKLVGEYRSKAKMKVKGTQHEIVHVQQETSTDVVLVDKEIMTDPIISNVEVSSIGINVRVSHLERVGFLDSVISRH